MIFPVTIMAMQIVAAIFFVIDGIEDEVEHPGAGAGLEVAMEWLVALALLGGLILSLRHVIRLTQELRWREQALARASGALGAHIAQRFRDWGLTPAEADVALFALKGCDIAGIARLRGAATGTVRSQLSQIYAKAGVTSQAMMISLFIEDLLGVPEEAPAR